MVCMHKMAWAGFKKDKSADKYDKVYDSRSRFPSVPYLCTAMQSGVPEFHGRGMAVPMQL